jgi:hypothetical protein
MNDVDDTATAQAILDAALRGRHVTRVMLDAAVTLQFSEYGHATIELKLETAFELTDQGVQRSILPEHLGEDAGVVASLFGQVVEAVDVEPENELVVTFVGGGGLRAPKHGDFESWSLVSDSGEQVVCLPSGGLAIWTSPIERQD